MDRHRCTVERQLHQLFPVWELPDRPGTQAIANSKVKNQKDSLNMGASADRLVAHALCDLALASLASPWIIWSECLMF